MDASRRAFMRGRFSAVSTPLRPPWALADESFLSACTRCAVCIEVCPNGIIRYDAAGFPEVDFTRGECSFCGKCVAACVPAALQRKDQKPPWSYRAAIGNTCLAQHNVVCRTCNDTCEHAAILFRPRLGAAAVPEVLMDACNGCGACVAACPAQAISISACVTA